MKRILGQNIIVLLIAAVFASACSSTAPHSYYDRRLAGAGIGDGDDDPPPENAGGDPSTENDPVRRAEGGTIRFVSPDAEPFDVNYTQGPVTDDELRASASQAAQIEKNAGDGVIPYFVVEGDDQAIPPEYAAAGLTVQKIEVPKKALEQAIAAEKRDGIYVKPKSRQWTMGVIFAGIRISAIGAVYVLSKNMDPMLALRLMLVVGVLVSGAQTVYKTTFERLFTYNAKTGRVGEASATTEFLRRFVFDVLLMAPTVNFLIGAPLSYDHAIINAAFGAIVNNLFGTQVNRMVGQRTELKIAYSLLTAPFFYSLQTAETALNWPVAYDFHIYKLKWSFAATLGIYASLMWKNWRGPQTVVGFLERVNKRVAKGIDHFGQWIHGATKGFCEELADPPRSRDDRDRLRAPDDFTFLYPLPSFPHS